MYLYFDIIWGDERRVGLGVLVRSSYDFIFVLCVYLRLFFVIAYVGGRDRIVYGISIILG